MKLSVDQAFLDDRVHHRVQQRDVGVRLELQVVRRVARELGAPRVGEDQLGAVLHGVLDPRRGHRMVDDRVGADQEARPRRSSRRSPGSTPRRSRCLRAAPRRSMRGKAACSGRRCCAEAGAHQLLEQVGLLVASPWPSRSRPARRRRARRGSSRACRRPASSASSQRRFAEDLERIRRDPSMKSADFGTPGLRISGLVRRCGWCDVVEAEAALHAQAVVVGRAVAAVDADDHVVASRGR